MVALGKALEELERPKARERQAEAGQEYGRGLDSSCSREQHLSGPKRDDSGYTRNVVGSALGMSGPTYQRAKTV